MEADLPTLSDTESEALLNNLIGGPRQPRIKYIAGYKLSSGKALALERGNIWLENRPPRHLGFEGEYYAPQRPRPHPLNDTHAPELSVGKPAWKVAPRTRNELERLVEWYDNTSTFLAKIHSDCCPDRNGQPQSEADWDGGWFNLKAAISAIDEESVPPVALARGDQIYVWVHEHEVGSTGRGLTALGIVEEVQDAGSDACNVLLRDVRLLDKPSPLGTSELRAVGRSASRVAARIQRYAHRQTLWLSLDERREWDAYLARRAEGPAPASLADEERKLAISENREINKASIKREVREVTIRNGQSAFRNAVLARCGFRCAISGYDVPAGLDAAHVIPVGQNHALAGDPLNGLALRADLHRLFDQGLFWIEEGKVVIGQELENTSYAALAGIDVFPLPDEGLLALRAETLRSLEKA